MLDLFDTPQRLPMADAEVVYHPRPDIGFDADDLFVRLRQQLPWEQHYVAIHDKVIPQPRLSSWHGEIAHTYSTLAHALIPHPWSPVLLTLRERVEALSGTRFNSMLANLYRDGSDAIGWHADDEPELGREPVIASLSLGAVRRFDMRRRSDHRRVAHLMLDHGSLLVMGGSMQRYWQHAIARTKVSQGERINLTFRLTRPLT